MENIDSICPVGEPIYDIVKVSSIDANGNYEEHNEVHQVGVKPHSENFNKIKEGLEKYHKGVEQKLAEEREKNIDVQQLNAVLNSKNPENVPIVEPNTKAIIRGNNTQYLKEFHAYMKSLGYKEISELIKISEHLYDEDYNIYKNLPTMTKDYIDAEAKKDKINIKDSKVFKEYVRIKTEDIISQLELDKAFNKFKEELNEAFEGKDCFEDLFNEDKVRIIEYYEKMATTYEKIADAIDNPTDKNTYLTAESQSDNISKIKMPNINYQDINGEYDLKAIDNQAKTAVPQNVKLSYINDSKSYREQAKKLRECKDGYSNAIQFTLLLDYIKNNRNEINRLRDGGKYIKRLNRFITEYTSYMQRSKLEFTESINDSIVKIAKAFNVKFDTIARLFIILVLKLRAMENNPKKVHYAYYSVQIMKRFYRIDLNNIQTDYVKNIITNFKDTMQQVEDLCNKSLNV